MAFVYFNAYQVGGGGTPDSYQLTGSTATWINNNNTAGFSAYTGDNQFWPSPDVFNPEEQKFLICWADNTVANTTSKGGTAKVSYWMVNYRADDSGYLEWLNEAIRCSGGEAQGSLSTALTTAEIQGIWTNYNTDITVGEIG